MFKESLQLLGVTLMPQHLLSRAAGRFAQSGLSRHIIPFYIKHFDIDAEQAEKPADQYETLQEFFTRRLKPGMRPIDLEDAQTIVSPVDGLVYAAGAIEEGRLWQVKGETYSLLDFLGGDKAMAERFLGGEFITLYLSPRDYHRIHMPYGGQIVQATYVPGSLFPVNAFALRNVSRLFARNERVISYIDSKVGLIGLAKVGATMVGSVRVVYGDYHTNAGAAARTESLPRGPRLVKGDELGRFEFGSTVILLFEKDRARLRDLKVGEQVVLGQPIADAVGELK